MIEILIVLLVLGAATVVFYPALAGMKPPPSTPGRNPSDVNVAADIQEQRAVLIERKDRLIRNLRELDDERAAGRIGETDYQDLKRRDEAQAARSILELEALDAAATSARAGKKGRPKATAGAEANPRRIGTKLAWIGGTALFAVILGITMSKAVTERAPGGTITGTMPGGGGGGPETGGDGSSPMFSKANPERLALLERQIARDSSNLKNLLEAGHLYLAEQRFDETATVTLKALTLDPRSAEANAHVAVLFMAEASTQESADSSRMAIDNALTAIDHAIRLDPQLPEAWLFKGMIMMAGRQDQKGAVEAWEHYLTVAPPGADTTRIAAMVRGFQRQNR